MAKYLDREDRKEQERLEREERERKEREEKEKKEKEEKELNTLKQEAIKALNNLRPSGNDNSFNSEDTKTINEIEKGIQKIQNAKDKDELQKIYLETINNINNSNSDFTFNPITSFKSDNYPHIILDSEEVENIFFKVKEYYTYLFKAKKKHEQTIQDNSFGANFVTSGFGAHAFNPDYPKLIRDLYLVIEMLLKWAKINEANKTTILQGVRTYIHALEQENDDFNRQLTLESQAIQTIQGFINTFHNATKKLLRKGSKNFNNNEIPDPYPQSPGKDTTNEINYALDPHSQPKQKENETSKGDNLDKIRNRDSKYKAGGNAYNYELHKLGIDIELAKATSLDFTKEYAHQTATAQTIKGYVLSLCSFHFCKYYKVKTFDDDLDLQSNIPLDMKEREINPYIKRFNSEYSFKQVKTQLNRYNDGLQPNITPIVKLDLIDESNTKYADQFLNLYTQLSAENKLKIKEIKEEKGKLYEYTIKYFYKDFKIQTLENREQTEEAHTTQANKIIKENKELTNSELQNLLSDYMFNEFSELNKHEYKDYEISGISAENVDGDKKYWVGIRGTAYKSDNTLNISCKLYEPSSQAYRDNNGKEVYKTYTKLGTYNTQALDYEITSIIKVRYKITLRREVSKAHLQEQIKKIQSLLKDELKEVGITDEYKNINTLEKNGLI